MTIPRHERIIFAGHSAELYSYPLEAYFEAAGHRFGLAWRSDAARGYIGHWEVRDGSLYLTHLHGHDAEGRPVSLASLFPGGGDRVLADWYSGPLKFGHGKVLGRTMLRTYYDWSIVLAIDHGRVVMELMEEGPAPPLAPIPEFDLDSFLNRLRAGTNPGLPD